MGSTAPFILWEKYQDSDAYRNAVQAFLEQNFPANS
jgi:hypothetical protein